MAKFVKLQLQENKYAVINVGEIVLWIEYDLILKIFYKTQHNSELTFADKEYFDEAVLWLGRAVEVCD